MKIPAKSGFQLSPRKLNKLDVELNLWRFLGYSGATQKDDEHR
jgi:hypothetical protein